MRHVHRDHDGSCMQCLEDVMHMMDTTTMILCVQVSYGGETLCKNGCIFCLFVLKSASLTLFVKQKL